MAEPHSPTPVHPSYQAVPVLEPAEDDTAIVDALPAPSPSSPVVLEAVDDESTVADAIPVKEKPPTDPITAIFRFVVRGVLLINSVFWWCFGVVVLMVGLAALAALPILQFLSLGYLLEAGARIARSGRIRDGFIGVRLAARLGGVVAGAWLLLLPVRFVSSMARAASIIDPGSATAGRWRAGLFILIGFVAVHIGLVCARGGRVRYFFWPFNFVWLLLRLLRGGYYVQARDAVWDTVMALRLPYYFWLGLRGFAGAMAWLIIPISLIAAGRIHNPLAPLVGLFGALLLTIVLMYLPFLQMRLAATNRFRGAFEICKARAAYRRAPWASTFALFITLLFALPLYLLKIEIVPREAAWLPSLVFIAFIYPARLLTGWALGRANRRKTLRHWFFRWTGRLPLLPLCALYVLIVYFTQFTSWNGVWSLYEQHAFLVPVPFFGM